MRKTIAIWSLLALCLLLTAIPQPVLGATKDTPLEYGKEYIVSGAMTQRWYISVNPGDNITVNVSKVVSYYAYVNIDPSLRYSASSNDSLMDASGTTGTGLLSPFTLWFVCAHSQLVWLEFKTQVLSSSPSMTYNITRVNGTISQMPDDVARLKQDAAGLNSTLATLNSSLANLTSAFLANVSIVSNYTAYLNASIGELNASMLALIDGLNAAIDDLSANLSTQFQNITDLWENINGIWSSLTDYGLQEAVDFDNLKDQLAALNVSLLDADKVLRVLMETNDTVLRASLEANNGSLSGEILALNERLSTLRGEIQNISFPTPDQYNDTLLWKEIARINATPSYNDTPLWTEVGNLKNNVSTTYTIVNNTTVTPMTTVYVNKTTDGKDSTGIAATAGVATGLIAGVVSTVVMTRRRKYTP